MSRSLRFATLGWLVAALLAMLLLVKPTPPSLAATPAPTMAAPMMTQAEFMAYFNRRFEAVNTLWRTGNATQKLIDDLGYTPDFVYHYTPYGPSNFIGLNTYLSAMTGMRNAFPDLQQELKDAFISGDRYVYWLRLYGTHTGMYIDVWTGGIAAPTGKKVEWNVMEICRLSAPGKTAECWELADNLSLLLQLGFVAMPPKS